MTFISPHGPSTLQEAYASLHYASTSASPAQGNGLEESLLHDITASSSSRRPNDTYTSPVDLLSASNPPHFPQEKDWDRFKALPQIQLGQEFDSSGKSILAQWLLNLGGQTYACQVPMPGGNGDICGVTKGRLDRALVHVRSHLDLKPFVCGGQCSKDW